MTDARSPQDGGPTDAIPTAGDLVRAGVWMFVLLGVWVLLTIWNPDSTYHIAPLVVAVAWPVGVRGRIGPQRPVIAFGIAAGSTAVAIIATLVLDVFNRLEGPVLVGTSGVSESMLAALIGGLIGLIVLVVGAKILPEPEPRESEHR